MFDQTQLGEDLALPAPHRVAVVWVRVVVTAEVEQAVDHVERQLVPGVDPASRAVAAAISAETTSSPAEVRRRRARRGRS